MFLFPTYLAYNFVAPSIFPYFFPPSDPRITALALGSPLPDKQPIRLLQGAKCCFSHSHRETSFTEHILRRASTPASKGERHDNGTAEMPRSSPEHRLKRRQEQGGSKIGEYIAY